MKKIFYLLFFVALHMHAFATDVTKSKDKDFTINAQSTTQRNDDNNQAEIKQYSITLTGEYSSKTNSVKIKFKDSTSDSFDLEYPLDFGSFKIRFDSLFNESNDGYIPTYQSSLEVFYWVVTINEEENSKPLAGKLVLNPFVVVSDNLSIRDPEKNTQYARNAFLNKKLDEYYLNVEKLKMIENKEIPVTTAYIKKNCTLEDFNENVSKSFKEIKNLNLIKPKSEVLTKDFVVTKDDSISQINNFFKLELFNENSFNDKQRKSGDTLVVFIPKAEDEKFKQIVNDYKEVQSTISDIKKNLANNSISEIENVQIQFERGFLERIQVSVKLGNGSNEIFENFYPIGFSSVTNFKNLSRIKLFPRTDNSMVKFNDRQFIYLSDVIQNYHNRLDNVTRDYSPADTVIDCVPDTNPFVNLTKQSSIHIIDGKTFTDLNGFNEKSPNGLVQVELSRRFNLNTHRNQARKANNYGFFLYLNAQVNFSKIENKLKGLPLRNERIIENNTVVSPSYATNLDFMRYENLSIRTDINFLIFDVPHFKASYYIDFGLKYGHTPVVDSTFVLNQTGALVGTDRDLDAHSFTLYPKIWMELFAERRYGLKLSYQTNFTRIFTNNNFKQVLSYSDKGADLASLSINPSARWSHTIEAFAFFDPNPKSRTGKIFALARFHFQHKDANTFYPQILLGYAFNIFN